MFSLLSSATCCNCFSSFFFQSDLVSICVSFFKCTFLVPLLPLYLLFSSSFFSFVSFPFSSFLLLFFFSLFPSSCVCLFARILLCDFFIFFYFFTFAVGLFKLLESFSSTAWTVAVLFWTVFVYVLCRICVPFVCV